MGFFGLGFVGILMGGVMANSDGGVVVVVLWWLGLDLLKFFFYGFFYVGFVIVMRLLKWVLLGSLMVVLWCCYIWLCHGFVGYDSAVVVYCHCGLC